VYVHTPLITAADCEGAGEQFVVSTLLPEHGKVADIPANKKGLIDYTKDFFGKALRVW
jgi:asparaginyl-tRNA synthetase